MVDLPRADQALAMDHRRSLVWKRAFRLAELACRAEEALPARIRFAIGSQIIRSATSVPSNIAEGWARESRREKAHFMAIAQGSLDELDTQVLLCERMGWIEPAVAHALSELHHGVGCLLTSFRRRLRAERPER